MPFNANGQIDDSDIGRQTVQTLENLERVLQPLGLNRTHIVKATVWLRPGADFLAFNESYAGFFGDHRPARSTVYSALLIDQANIEIEAVAQALNP